MSETWKVTALRPPLSLMMSASGIGGLLVPVLVELISNFGWRPIIIFAGVGFWVVGFPATLVMRSTPEDYGLNPDGKEDKKILVLRLESFISASDLSIV